MYVTVLMDVEDIVDPEADEIAKTCADILKEEGITATLCIVGEKARLLSDRGRTNVITALASHDIGYHTDFHSVHPTIAEYLSVCDWESGTKEALRREAPGIRAIREVFGVSPSCFGGPGNTWGPAVCKAIRQEGVPAFVYAHTALPEGGVHRFADVVAYPNGRNLSDSVYQDDNAANVQISRIKAEIKEDAAAGLFWQQIFIGHPTRILHERFWDDPDFAAGANPPRREWKPAPKKSEGDLKKALDNFRTSVRAIRNFEGIELKTIREMNAIFVHQPYDHISEAEQATVWPDIENRLRSMARWPILPFDIDLTSICIQTKSLLSTIERFRTHPSDIFIKQK